MATPVTTSEIQQGADIPAPSRLNARLRLEFRQSPATGRTYLAQSEEQPPLKVVRGFSLEDGTALVHLHNVSGGLLGGDQLTLEIAVGVLASVQVTTTGATRIYRRREGLSPTVQHNEFRVGKNAMLEYLPDAAIPFGGACYRQYSSIHMEEGAGLFWWEILSPGREARGELFRYDQVEIRTRITTHDKIIAAENLCLRPAFAGTSSLSRLGPYRYLATFYACRAGLGASAWRIAEEHLRELAAGWTRPGEMLWGVSSLVAHGLVVRCLARNGREVLPGLQAIWGVTKRHLYNLEAIPPRKVN